MSTAWGGTTYYIRNGGNDAANGQSEVNAWETFLNVKTTTFGAGDEIRLQRGSKWAEELILNNGGTLASPAVVTAYGTLSDPLPIIERGNQTQAMGLVCLSGIDIHDWRIERIYFCQAHRGINFESTLGSGNENITVSHCYFDGMDDPAAAHNEWSTGLSFRGAVWDDITVTSCTFKDTTNGVSIYCTDANDVHISDCEAFGGLSAGFALTNVNVGLVSNFHVHDVGGSTSIGTCGAYLNACDHLVVTDCSFARVAHGGGADGVGLDFEAFNTDCTLTRCSFFENEGAAILMFSPCAPIPGMPCLPAPNLNITISDCLFYNNNLLPHSVPPHPVGSNANLFAAVGAGSYLSTGHITDCGSYVNGSTPHFSSNWSGFIQSNTLEGTYCTDWTPVYGKIKRLAVGGNGHIAGIDRANSVVAWNGDYFGNCWNSISTPATMRSVSIGNDGEMWANGSDNKVWQYTGSGTWSNMHLNASKVAVGSSANIQALDLSSNVRLWTGSGWSTITNNIVGGGTVSLVDLDVGPAATDYAWGINGGGSNATYRFNGSAWESTAGTLTQVSERSYDKAVGVDGTTIRGTTNGGTTWSTYPGALKQVSQGSDGSLWGIDNDNHIWRWQ